VTSLEVAEGRITAAVSSMLRRAVGTAAAAFLQRVQQTTRLGQPGEEIAIIAAERQRANAYLDAMHSRLDAELAQLTLSTLTDAEKRAVWSKAVAEEARYLEMHLDASRERLSKAAQLATVKAASPEGAVWRLGNTKVHTPDCIFMAGKAWSWRVLKEINPYTRHPGCKCYLEPVPEGMQVNDEIPSDFMLMHAIEGAGRPKLSVGVEPVKPLERSLVSQSNRRRKRLAMRSAVAGRYRRVGNRIVFVPARTTRSKQSSK